MPSAPATNPPSAISCTATTRRWSRSHCGYVHDRQVAEDVVQETWMALIGRLDRFEGRSSLKTWLFAVLGNPARTHWRRRARVLPGFEDDGLPRSTRPVPRNERPLTGALGAPPGRLDVPAGRAEAGELRAVIHHVIRQLPAGHAAVITLRDVEGWTATEVRAAVDLSPGNQRVLLHRARSALARYLGDGG